MNKLQNIRFMNCIGNNKTEYNIRLLYTTFKTILNIILPLLSKYLYHITYYCIMFQLFIVLDGLSVYILTHSIELYDKRIKNFLNYISFPLTNNTEK